MLVMGVYVVCVCMANIVSSLPMTLILVNEFQSVFSTNWCLMLCRCCLRTGGEEAVANWSKHDHPLLLKTMESNKLLITFYHSTCRLADQPRGKIGALKFLWFLSNVANCVETKVNKTMKIDLLGLNDP